MNILIGLHCNEKKHQVETAKILRDELHLLPYNLKQPVLDAAAIILGTNAHELSKCNSGSAKAIPWALTPAQLQIGITKVLQAGNPNAFLDNGKIWLNNSRNSKLSSIFNGHLIQGITTEQEAQFIRDEGGLVIHVIGSERDREITIHSGDAATYYVANEQPSKISLVTIAQTYRHKLDERTNKAA